MNGTYKLSICIPTLNRASFIGATLDSIVDQLRDDVEVVLVDGGSNDGTESIVTRYMAGHPQIRYISKEEVNTTPSNEGFDRDCNTAVELARGTYCWLMTDDDLLVPGAISSILHRLVDEPELVVVSSRICNVDLSNVLVERLPALDADIRYDRASWNTFAMEVGSYLSFVGRIVIRRAVWMAREREPHFGSGFIHVGVILSKPMERMLLVAEPLVIVRYGNGLWRSRAFDIWMFQWPRLIWSFADLPDAVKAAVTKLRPYRSLKRLLWFRALGAYSVDKYRERVSGESGRGFRLAAVAIALMPIALANAVCWLYLLPVRSRSVSMQLYDLLRCGHAIPFSRQLARLRRVY